MCGASRSPGGSGCRGAPCSHSCRFAWAARGGPGPRSAGAGTVRLQRGVTVVPGTLPRGSLGRVTRRKGAAAATAERGHRLPLSVAGPGCESGLRALRLSAARVWEHEAGLLRAHRLPGLGVGWHGVPGRRGPQGPLFQLHVARFSCQARGEGGGRSEGAAALTCQL